MHQETGDPTGDCADSLVTSEAHTEILRDMDTLLEETSSDAFTTNQDTASTSNTSLPSTSNQFKYPPTAGPTAVQPPAASLESSMREMDPAVFGDNMERDSIFGGTYSRGVDGTVEHEEWPESEGVRMREFEVEDEEEGGEEGQRKGGEEI